jgi:hypothetical protein
MTVDGHFARDNADRSASLPRPHIGIKEENEKGEIPRLHRNGKDCP